MAPTNPEGRTERRDRRRGCYCQMSNKRFRGNYNRPARRDKVAIKAGGNEVA
jgi:hypothetical protein